MCHSQLLLITFLLNTVVSGTLLDISLNKNVMPVTKAGLAALRLTKTAHMVRPGPARLRLL